MGLARLIRIVQVKAFLTSAMVSPIKTFVFLDLETTGLPWMENNTTRVTEMCCVAVQADHIELGVFPRVQNKLSLCFNPNKLISPVCTDITGLSNELLENQSRFSAQTVATFKGFLDNNRGPICFVAHNGKKFDYPILRAEIDKAGGFLADDVLCIDSLLAFRELDKEALSKKAEEKEAPLDFDDGFNDMLCTISDELERSLESGDSQGRLTASQMQRINETTPEKQKIRVPGQAPPNDGATRPTRKSLFPEGFKSYKLGDVYRRLTSKEPTVEHEAEGDVFMLIMCAATLAERFVAYANANAAKFSEMPIMKPGRRL